jgi:hypothetical protein
VRLDLKKDEEAEALAGREPLRGTSATAFLTAGLQLEEAQYVTIDLEVSVIDVWRQTSNYC